MTRAASGCWKTKASRLKIHRTYLSDVERGQRNVSLVHTERLASALAVSTSELFRLVEQG